MHFPNMSRLYEFVQVDVFTQTPLRRRLYRYFAATAFVALPPRLLRMVMFCGLVETLNWPEYLPAPLFVSVPINAFVDVT